MYTIKARQRVIIYLNKILSTEQNIKYKARNEISHNFKHVSLEKG